MLRSAHEIIFFVEPLDDLSRVPRELNEHTGFLGVNDKFPIRFTVVGVEEFRDHFQQAGAIVMESSPADQAFNQSPNVASAELSGRFPSAE